MTKTLKSKLKGLDFEIPIIMRTVTFFWGVGERFYFYFLDLSK